MPLSDPAPRDPIHTRTLSLNGYRRKDGLWDIEGHLTDVKAYPFGTEYRGRLEPGDPIHEMWLRLTVDDDLVVRAVDVATDKSPYGGCSAIVGAFQTLVGLRIAPGWTRATRERLGGVQGCTHLVELLGPLGTTAFQTVFPILAREQEERAEAEGRAGARAGRPALLNTCHMYASDGELVRRNWPDHYTGTGPAEAAD